MVHEFFKHHMPYSLAKAYELQNSCECGAVSDKNWLFKPDLLKGPVASKCMRHTFYEQKTCFREWSVAIPLGDCKQRRDIENLIALGRERDNLIDRLEVVNTLIRGEN